MSEFSEDQRIVIRALIADEASRQLKESAELKKRIDAVVDEKLPWLTRLEKMLGTWYKLAGVVIAIPLASAGAAAGLQSLLSRGMESYLATELGKEDGPVKGALKKFNAFSGKLSEQFSHSVDSATSKLLRFGCNLTAAPAAVEGFPPCDPHHASNSPSIQARNVQEINDQTIVFKADDNQRVLLKLRLSPIDGPEVLRTVGLRLQTPPLLATGGSETHNLRLEKQDLPDTHDFVDAQSGLLKLYGSVADRSDLEPLHVDIDITRHLRKKTDLHALRFRAETVSADPTTRNKGSERFYLHAIVVVTHSLPKE